MNSVTVTWTLVVKLILWSFLLCLTFVSLWEEATQKNDNASFLCILQILCVLNLELFLCMSCLGLLVHAVRRTLPVLPYVCPHTSLVPLSHCLWGAGHCTGMDPWDSAGPSLPHPQGMEALYPYINFCCSAGIITGGLWTQHISEYSPLNSLATWCFGFTDAAFQENCLRTQNHLFLALNWDCKAKDTATIAPLTSDTDQTISRYWGKELAKIKIKLTAKRITIFQETKFSLLEYPVWC